MRKKIFFLAALLIIIFSVFNLSSNSKQIKTNNLAVVPIARHVFSYRGQTGKNALTVLKQKFTVMQDKSGLVIGIAGKKANSAKREYWAFYVNGKMASVGPADYQTTNSDLIEWKIEKY